MKQCPNCGKKFNWWQRAVGEAKEHLSICQAKPDRPKSHAHLATGCRGCPAGCFERADYSGKQ